MPNDMIKVNAKEFQQLVNEVNQIKQFLFCYANAFDSEGILSEWAVKEIEKSRHRISNGEFISNEEMLQEFKIK